MSKKGTTVDSHRRSTPNRENPWPGPGNKPGPKSVPVREHQRGSGK